MLDNIVLSINKLSSTDLCGWGKYFYPVTFYCNFLPQEYISETSVCIFKKIEMDLLSVIVNSKTDANWSFTWPVGDRNWINTHLMKD